MIDNDYIFEIDLQVDIDKLLAIALAEKKYTGNYKKHQHHIDADHYLKEIKNKLPILGEIWNFYYFLPYEGIDLHIDAQRKCALNIPLQGAKSSITKFYQPQANLKTEYSEKHVLHYIKNSLEPDFEFTLTKPTLIRTDVPHSVKAGNVPRMIISWGIQELDFFEAKKFFKSMSML